jgi:hypothetical protein
MRPTTIALAVLVLAGMLPNSALGQEQVAIRVDAANKIGPRRNGDV